MDLVTTAAQSFDWEVLVTKLRKVERSCVLQEFLDSFDAASLSSCFLPDEEEAVGGASGTLRRPELKGLTRLIHSLTLLLNEGYIAQQSVLTALKAECLQCSRVAQLAVSQSESEPEIKVRAGAARSDEYTKADQSVITSTDNWSSLPTAEDDDGDSHEAAAPITARIAGLFSSRSQHKRHGQSSHQPSPSQRADAIKRQLQRQMQSTHDRAIELINTKLHAFEIISHCHKTFKIALIRLATSKGVSRASARATILLDSALLAVRTHKFLESDEAQDVVNTIRDLWSQTHTAGHRNLAERRLQLTHDATLLSREQNSLRLKLGAGLALLAWAVSECFNNEQVGRGIWHDPTFAIFMCFGDLLLLLWMWGLSMQVWRASGIDFVRLLSLQDTEVAPLRTPEFQVYSSAIDLTLLFLVVFIAFNKAVRGVLYIHGSLAYAHALPTLMVIYFAFTITNPPHLRNKWLSFLGQVLSAPCFPVVFRDGYIGDLLTSLVRVLIPMCYSFAYLLMSTIAWLSNDLSAAASTSNLWWKNSSFFRFFLVPFLTLFPLWIRLMQCLRRSVETGKRWPHMANALKYTSAIVVISFGTFQPRLRENPLWIASFIFATLYQFVWDLTMDWGIVVPSSSPSASSLSWGGLSIRRTRLLGPLYVYITVICCNLVLRFAWTLTLLPNNPYDNSKSLYSLLLAYLSPLVAAAEVLRRMVWGFFRLEYEQLEVLRSTGKDHSNDDWSGAGTGTGAGNGLVDGSSKSVAEFEKMSITTTYQGNSDDPEMNTFDPDGRSTLLPRLTRSLVQSESYQDQSLLHAFELDWLPIPAFVIEGVAVRSWLDSHATRAMKTRLVESVAFACAVVMLILHAASYY